MQRKAQSACAGLCDGGYKDPTRGFGPNGEQCTDGKAHSRLDAACLQQLDKIMTLPDLLANKSLLAWQDPHATVHAKQHSCVEDESGTDDPVRRLWSKGIEENNGAEHADTIGSTPGNVRKGDPLRELLARCTDSNKLR